MPNILLLREPFDGFRYDINSFDLFFNDELAVITRLCYSTRYYISKMVASDHVIIHKKI